MEQQKNWRSRHSDAAAHCENPVTTWVVRLGNDLNVYSNGASEEVVGKALREFASRDEVVIATKVCFEMGPGPNDRGLSRKHILSSIDASLKRLGTDYVDLYQIRR